jgi:ubiquinone/menaquinone biosynthesis C-methylase UbiE
MNPMNQLLRRASLRAPLALAGLISLAACAGDAPDGSGAADAESRYTYTARNREGIGKFYMGREISHVMGHQGARWLDREERKEEERTDVLLQNLPISPGDSVADIGAGSGYFTLPMASAVAPEGTVYAVDIQPEMLAIIEGRAAAAGADNIELVLADEQTPGLPPASIDLALFVDVYHELEWPFEVMTALIESMKPGGKIVLIEYRAEDPTVPILRLHKMSESQVRAEMAALGLEFVSNANILPRQHFLIFQKPLE